MTRVEAPQTRCRAAFAQADITPPVGIYHRMWGAATHDTATGVHRPLTATALFLESVERAGTQIVLALDHCLLDRSEVTNIRRAVSSATGLQPGSIQVALSHTHGAGWMSRSRSHLPGGEEVGPYLDHVAAACAEIAASAKAAARSVTILYGKSRCDLAAHRDFWDETSEQFVCGYNPSGPTDDTVLLAKVVADSGDVLGTVVNYACHPTTLAWQNTLISPDYVGAMREVVESHTQSPCVFLLGACGDLGPREGYVGDPAVADRNGRQLGFAALSGLEPLAAAGTVFEYAGPVLSGATLGSWEHRPLSERAAERNTSWTCRSVVVEVPYRADLPTMAQTRADLAMWQEEEAAATDPTRRRDCRAMIEQMTRQIARLQSLPEGKAFPLSVEVWHLGGAFWVFSPGELYHAFQTTLRQRFPDRPLLISTVTNGWQPGYVPTAASYGKGIYQEKIAAIAPESLGVLIEAISNHLRELA
jgi:hypothetical protein